MRKLVFSIEDNGPMLEIGREYQVTEYSGVNYYYLLENSYGMSSPIPANRRLKCRAGRLVELTTRNQSNIAVMEFDESDPDR